MRSDHRQRKEGPLAVDAPPLVGQNKRVYSRPVLQDLGPVLRHTLAPTPGSFESGLGTGFRSQ